MAAARVIRRVLAFAANWGLSLGIASAAEARTGPVSVWTFEESLRDEAGREHDQLTAWDRTGQIVVARRVTADEVAGTDSKAIALGVKPDDAVRLSGCTSPDVLLGPSYTIALWVHATTLGEWARLVLCWGPGRDHAYHVGIHRGQASLYHGQADGAEAVCEGGRVETGRWHHLVATAERNKDDPARSTLRVYLDGRCVAESAYDGSYRSDVGEGIGIGDSASAPSETARFQGYLDDVMLWRRALTAAEIRALCAERLKALPEQEPPRPSVDGNAK
jgi:hypothetical protein